MDAQPVDLLLRHARIVTMDAERRILSDGSIAIRGARIVAVGPDRELEPAYARGAVEVRDLGGAVAHPGLIDAHVHTASELQRGFTPKADPDWGAIDNAYYGPKGPDGDYLGSLLSAMELIRNGTTTFCDTGSSRDLGRTAAALEEVGVRGIPGHLIFDVLAEPDMEPLVHATEECFARIERQIDAYPFRGEGVVRCAVTMSGMGLNTDELLVAAAHLARRRNVPMVMHQSWGGGEVTASLERYGKRPIFHLADLGILGPNLTLVHMIQLDDAEVALLATTGTRVVHCPNASFRRGKGAIRVGRFPELIAAGATVALGSDGMGGKRDLFRQMHLAITAQREVRNEYPVFTAEQAFEMATLHGARAVGLEDEIGSLEPGKRADIVIHTMDRPEAHPRWADAVDNLVFYGQSASVDTVYVDGRAVLDGGRFTRLDATDAYRRIDAAAAGFEALLGRKAFATWPIVD